MATAESREHDRTVLTKNRDGLKHWFVYFTFKRFNFPQVMKTLANLAGKNADQNGNCRLLQTPISCVQPHCTRDKQNREGKRRKQLKIQNVLYIAVTPSQLKMMTKLAVISVKVELGSSCC